MWNAGLQYGGPPPSSGVGGGAPQGFTAQAGGPRGHTMHMDDEAARKIFEQMFGGGFGMFQSSGGGDGNGHGCDHLLSPASDEKIR